MYRRGVGLFSRTDPRRKVEDEKVWRKAKRRDIIIKQEKEGLRKKLPLPPGGPAAMRGSLGKSKTGIKEMTLMLG